MKPSQPIFLKPGMTVNIDGVKMTFAEIKEAKIDSILYRKHLKELQEKAKAK